MAVRSDWLGVVQGAATPGAVVFTVPAGQTWLAKDWRYFNTAVVAAAVILKHRIAGTDVYIDQRVVGAGATSAERGAFVVLNPGDQLRLEGTANQTVIVYGAKLAGVAP